MRGIEIAGGGGVVILESVNRPKCLNAWVQRVGRLVPIDEDARSPR